MFFQGTRVSLYASCFWLEAEVYYTVFSETHTKDAEGNIIADTFKTYSDYMWDKEKGMYVGVGETGTYMQVNYRGQRKGSPHEKL